MDRLDSILERKGGRNHMLSIIDSQVRVAKLDDFVLEEHAKRMLMYLKHKYGVDQTCKEFNGVRAYRQLFWTLAILSGDTDCVPPFNYNPHLIKIAMKPKSLKSFRYIVDRAAKQHQEAIDKGRVSLKESWNKLPSDAVGLLKSIEDIMNDVALSRIILNSSLRRFFVDTLIRQPHLFAAAPMEIKRAWIKYVAKSYVWFLRSYASGFHNIPAQWLMFRNAKPLLENVRFTKDFQLKWFDSFAGYTNNEQQYSLHPDFKIALMDTMHTRMFPAPTAEINERLEEQLALIVINGTVCKDRLRTPHTMYERIVRSHILESVIFKLHAPFLGKRIFGGGAGSDEQLKSISDDIQNGVFGSHMANILRFMRYDQSADEKANLIKTALSYVFTQSDYSPGGLQDFDTLKEALRTEVDAKQQNIICALVAFFWGLSDEFSTELDALESRNSLPEVSLLYIGFHIIFKVERTDTLQARNLYYADKHIKDTMKIAIDRLKLRKAADSDPLLALTMTALVGNTIDLEDVNFLRQRTQERPNTKACHAKVVLDLLARQASLASFKERRNVLPCLDPFLFDNHALLEMRLRKDPNYIYSIPLARIWDRSREFINIIVKFLKNPEVEIIKKVKFDYMSFD